MDLRRPRPGEWAMAAAAVALLVSLFLPWYQVGSPAGEVSGWRALAAIDLWLAAAAALGLAAFAASAVEANDAAAIALTALAGLAGTVATVLVVLRVVDQPGDLQGAGPASAAPGAWLGIGAALALTAAAIVAMRDERPRGAVPERPIEVRPAPAPDGSTADGAGAPTYNRRR